MTHPLNLSGIVLLAAVTAAGTARAQDRELQMRLAHAERVDCRFGAIATGDWNDGKPAFKTADAMLESAFFNIDVDTGTAEAEGRFGTSYIVVRYADGYLHFMQTLSSGPIYLTTIFAEPAGDGRLKAVLTRHEYTRVALPGFTSRPEMYLGDCAVTADGD